jgi:hypothetical protein
MFPLAIFLFLAGATLAWAYRVWVMVPVTMLAMLVAFGFMLALGSDVLGAFGRSLLIGVMPQLGYAHTENLAQRVRRRALSPAFDRFNALGRQPAALQSLSMEIGQPGQLARKLPVRKFGTTPSMCDSRERLSIWRPSVAPHF